jgi:hypothetical protein
VSLLWVHAAKLRGVLHGTDADQNYYDAPYEVSHPNHIIEYSRQLTEANPGLRIGEMSHAGNCDEAGCKFYDKWVAGPQAFTKPDGTNGGGYKVHVNHTTPVGE